VCNVVDGQAVQRFKAKEDICF